jgi:Zn-dependent protease
LLVLNLFSNPFFFFCFIAALILALTVHEFAHAWAADKLGDSTAKHMGRLTLNPLAHLDPIGSIFLLLAGFGWGKPVPVNDRNFKNPAIDTLKVSVSGPLSNLLLAVIFAIPIRFLDLPANTNLLFQVIVSINLILMTFNLLPIPPLDGSSILRIFLGESGYAAFEQMGIYILIAILFFTPLISIIIKYVAGNIFIFLTNTTPILF